MLGQFRRRIVHGRLGSGVSVEVLDVGHVGAGAAEARGERVANLIGGENRQSSRCAVLASARLTLLWGYGPKAAALRKARAAATPSGASGTAAIRPLRQNPRIR